jgi:hypothetical protein
MATSERDWNPKQETLTDAIKELQKVKERLAIDRTLKDEYAILKIDTAISLIKGCIFGV